MISEAQIRKIAMGLHDALEQATHGGAPSWRTKKRMFAWIRPEPEALVIWVDSLDAKELLLEAEPELFFTTSHYDGYAMLLVRLQRLNPARARELIAESHRVRVGKREAKPARAAKLAKPSRTKPSRTKPSRTKPSRKR